MVHAAFAREIDLFRILVGEVRCFTLGSGNGWNPEVVQFFAKHFAVPRTPRVDRPEHEPHVAPPALPREVRPTGWRRAFAQAAGLVAVAGSLAAGYMWYATREPSVPSATATVEAEARAALAAVFEAPDALPDSVRHVRLRSALQVCKRPSADCAMEDVVRIGSELNRLRKT
jgi:hypothetical protein